MNFKKRLVFSIFSSIISFLLIYVLLRDNSSKENKIKFLFGRIDYENKTHVNNEFLKNLSVIYSNGLNISNTTPIKKTKSALLNSLYNNEAFCIDIEILKNLNDDKESIFSNDYITFGMLFEKFDYNKLVSELSNICSIDFVFTKYYHLEILSSIFMDCKPKIIHISIFYNRSNFYWIPGDAHKLNFSKLFNDKARALNK